MAADLKTGALGLSALLASLACTGRSTFWATDAAAGDPKGPPESLVVRPRYLSAPDWNDYVRVTDPGDAQTAGTVCTGDETGGPGACVHGGPARIVATTETACAGLAMTDELDVFVWTCAMAGSTAEFTSRLRPDKGLADLVSVLAWRPNVVTLERAGVIVARSPAVAWWQNPIYPLPDNATGCVAGNGYSCAASDVALLDVPGAIYVLDTGGGSPRASRGYAITASKVALSMAAGSAVRASGLAPNCDTCSGSLVGADACLVNVPGPTSFLWLEGTFDAIGPAAVSAAMTLHQLSYSTVRRVDIRGGGSALRVYDDCAGGGAQSHGNWFSQLRLSTSGGIGLAVLGTYRATENVFDGVLIANAGERTVQLEDSSYNTIVNLGIVGGGDGVIVASGSSEGSHGNLIMNATVMSVWYSLFRSWYRDTPASYNIVSNGVLINGEVGINGQDNADDTSFVGNTFAQVAVTRGHDPGLPAIYLGNAPDNLVRGNLLVGYLPPSDAGAVCDVSTSANVNIDDTCNGTGPQAATVQRKTFVDGAQSFVGKATADSTNPADASGTAAYDSLSVTDLFALDNPWRGWAADGSDFPAVDNIDMCSGSATCRIWDLTLRTADTVLRNRTGDGTNDNGLFVAGAACPLAADGDAVIDSAEYPFNEGYAAGIGANAVQTQPSAGGPCTATSTWCKRRFLKAAVEIVSPDHPFYSSTGNHDGLCESGEACLYSPNFGAYQGHGALAPCIFNDGALTGVTMVGYASNGF